MKPDNHERRSRDARPQPAWRGVHPATPCKAALLLAIAMLSSGCRTTAMKGTPFFSGEYKGRVGPAENRVNLWPLVYWRDPALSVLWPVGEYADDRIAVRPLFSRYRDKPDGPYTETNVLWPIARFDAKHGDYRVFPYFWGRTWDDGSYHVLFPLLWDYRHPKRDAGCNAFFPLWIHDWDENKGWSETDILWPIFNRETGPNTDYVRLFPLFGRSRNPQTGDGFDWALAGLLGRGKENGSEYYWAIPFFLRDVQDDVLWTPLWCGSLGGDKRWWFVPPLLSGGRRDKDGSDTLTVLLAGLAGWMRTGGELDTSWLLPLWYREGNNFFSLPYAYWRSGDGTKHVWCTPLFGTMRGTHSGSWLFPLWYWDDGPDGSYDRSFLLVAGASHNGWNGTTRYLFPLWWRQTRGDDPDDLAAELAARQLPEGDWSTPRFVPEDPKSFRIDDPGWMASGSRETRWLLGLAGSCRSASRRPEKPWDRRSLSVKGRREADFADPAGADAPGAADPLVRYRQMDENWFFPLWNSETTRGAAFDPGTGERVASGETEEFSLLWFLYDYRHESAPEDGHEYARRRVLWRLYHDETLDGDRSVDVFPGIGIDSRKDGYRKYSFLWRLFRYERDPAKGTSLDILFIPFRRPQAKAAESAESESHAESAETAEN